MKLTREAKIGLFATICLAVLFWGVNFLKGKDIFTRTNTYHAIFTRIDGLKQTDNVLVSGYKVGTVKSIRFEEGNTGRLFVTMIIQKKYPVPVKSIAKLVSADIMGGKAIKLEISPNKVFHKTGDTLISSIETGLVDQLIHEMVPVKEKAERLMEDVEKVMEVIQQVFNHENRTNIDHSILSLRISLQNLERTSSSLDTMLNENGSLYEIINNVQSISKNLEENNQAITNIINNFSSISDSMARANIASTLIQADSAIHSFNHIVDKINRGEGTMGLLVNNDTLYYNVTNASRNLELLLEDLKANPKRYVSFSIFGSKKDKK
jgi:phospholipid/cholesterol/gamma-HCH transport system substrate-binding protein